MEENTDNNIIILRYIKGQLTEQELHTFEQRMKDDTAFAEEVEFVKKYYQYEQHKEFEQALSRFNQQKKEEGFFDEIEQKLAKETGVSQPEIKPISNRKWLRPLMAVAAILLGAFIIWKGLLPAQITPNYAQNIAQEMVEFPADLKENYGFNASDDPIDTLKKAVQFYENKEYEKASELFEIYLAHIKGNDTDIRFFLAKSYLLMKPPKLDKALFHFEKASGNDSFREEIVLNQGATYILKEDYDKALGFLKQQQKNVKKYAQELNHLIQEAEYKNDNE